MQSNKKIFPQNSPPNIPANIPRGTMLSHGHSIHVIHGCKGNRLYIIIPGHTKFPVKQIIHTVKIIRVGSRYINANADEIFVCCFMFLFERQIQNHLRHHRGAGGDTGRHRRVAFRGIGCVVADHINIPQLSNLHRFFF